MKSFSQRLEHWREETEPKRERRALLVATVLTLILFILWLGSFRLSTSLRSSPTAQPAAVVVVDDKTGIVTGVVERVKAGWQTLTQ